MKKIFCTINCVGGLGWDLKKQSRKSANKGGGAHDAKFREKVWRAKNRAFYGKKNNDRLFIISLANYKWGALFHPFINDAKCRLFVSQWCWSWCSSKAGTFWKSLSPSVATPPRTSHNFLRPLTNTANNDNMQNFFSPTFTLGAFFDADNCFRKWIWRIIGSQKYFVCRITWWWDFKCDETRDWLTGLDAWNTIESL